MAIDPAASPAEWSRRRALIGLGLILAAALLLRLAMALWSFCSTFDTATVGLMAVNILTKGERPLFFYGQGYFGSIEAYAAALIFKGFGISEIALSMAPILFSLGWLVATYFLFTEWAGRRAGLAGAAVMAVPGFVTLRYCVGTDGGYPTAFMLGTMALWLCLRIQRRNPTGFALLGHSIPLGAAAGLGLWTHALSATYLLPGALLLLAYLFRQRFRASALVPLLAAVIPFLACLAPVVTVMDWSGTGSGGVSLSLSRRAITSHFYGLFHRPLRQHLFNQWSDGWTWWMMRGLLAATVILYIQRGLAIKTRAGRIHLAYPIIFTILFTVLYVMNPMARVMAPRYIIPMWLTLLAGLLTGPLTSPAPGPRRIGWALLAAWMLFYGLSNSIYIIGTAPRRTAQMESRQWVVATAREAGLKSVVTGGSAIYGHHGQIYSFTSHGEIAFVSPYDERHRPSAAFAERDENAGMMIETGGARLLGNALSDVGATWREFPGPGHTLFDQIKVVPLAGPLVPGSAVCLETPDGDPPEALSDRRLHTAVGGSYGDGKVITLYLDQPRAVEALVLVGDDVMGQRLPRQFFLEGSVDGETFFEVRPPRDRVAIVYTAGNQAWIKGYQARSEYRFPPITVRALKLTPLRGQRRDDRHWRLSEVFIHEAGPAPTRVEPSEVDRIAEHLGKTRIDFVAADRWLSARLDERWSSRDDRPRVFPRRNPKFRDTLVSRRLAPRAGLALAVSTPLADETAHVLQSAASDANWDRVTTGHYTLFVFQAPDNVESVSASLEWFGAYLMRAGADGGEALETEGEGDAPEG